MNHQANVKKFKHQNLVTVLTELACLCLVFASILFGSEITRVNKKLAKESAKDGLVSWYESNSNSTSDIWKDLAGEGKFEASDDKSENGNFGYVINGSVTDKDGKPIVNIGEITTDENGNKYYVYGDGNAIFNGSISSDDLPSHIIVDINGNAQIHGSTPKRVSLSPLNNVIPLISPFLACVALMLFALTLYNKKIGDRILPVVFGLQSLAALLELIDGFAFSNSMDASSLLLHILPQLILLVLFVLLTLQAWKGAPNHKMVLITFIATTLFYLIGLLLGPINPLKALGADMVIISDLLYAIGFLSFAAAWFLYAFWNRPAEAPSGEEPAETAAEAETIEAP